MIKTFTVSLVLAVTLLASSVFAPSYAQSPASADTPTFYRLVPGTFVNGWPRFTVHYPTEWIELLPRPEQVFRAAAPGPTRYPAVGVSVGTSPHPLEKFVDLNMALFKTIGTDMTVVSDKPSRLRDGTPAREAEIQGVVNGAPFDWVGLGTKKGDLWIMVTTSSLGGRIGEELKAYLYSLEFQPGFDEPVKVPPDVHAFLDSFRNDVISHDLNKVMTHFSDRLLDSGKKKAYIEQWWRQYIGTVASYEIVITDFIATGDRAYLTGFATGYWGKAQFLGTSIINENGEWKFYGNQRDALTW